MDDIRAAVRSRDLEALQAAVASAPQAEVAAELVRVGTVDQAVLFRLLQKDKALRVFERLDPRQQATLLDSLGADEVTELLEELDPDDRARLLDEVPAKVAAKLLDRVSPAQRHGTGILLGYAPETAGRIMTPEYLSIRSELTAGEALERVRRFGVDAETIDVLYVIDDQRRLIGVVTLRSLVLVQVDAIVGSIMNDDPVWASTGDDREAVARQLVAHDLLAIPVVDREHRLVGIVTVDDAVAVLEREDTEDVERIGGASPLDEPYITAPVRRIYRARVGWLLVLFVAEALTGTVLRAFESVLESAVSLTFFVPLLIGTGGNAGSQTTTTIVRAMAIGEVRFGDAVHVMWKEVRVGLMLGATMAGVGIVRAVTWGTGERLAFVVASALVAVVLLATFVGSLLPMLLRRLGLDPAVVSAPFITTFVDAVGLLIYFLLARAILGL